jgi:Trk K+ transport system NAD-binding subunit
MIENYLDRPGVAELFEIETGVASLIDMMIPEGAQVVGQQIKDIDIPERCVVAAVIRGEEFVVPRGRTEIFAGDHVVFVGPSDAVQAAHEIFSALQTV